MKGWEVALTAVGTSLGAAAVLWPLGIWYTVYKCEKPKYTVIRALGRKRGWWAAHAELRQYAPMLIAEVQVDGSMRESSSKGFRAIANFIFGNNTVPSAVEHSGSDDKPASAEIAMTSPVRMELAPTSEAVAMTSPVRMTLGEAGGRSERLAPRTMSFVMPSRYSLESLPKPNNPDVVVKEVPAHQVAVISFRGQVRGTSRVERYEAELRQLLQEEGLKPVGPPQLYQYYPPFTYGLQRVNEVVLEVEQA